MLTPSAALARILARIPAPVRVEEVPLAAAHGRCLAGLARSDVDLPPVAKCMMDGFAVRAADVPGPATLRVVGESRAGAPWPGAVPPGSCVEIFTGAELPPGCDAVVMVEHVARPGDAGDAGDSVRFERPVEVGQNVGHVGEILRRDQAVYEPRRRLSAADLAVLASIGGHTVPVFARPRVSVLTTGDELVPPEVVPGRGQIREGNTFYLRASCAALGCEVVRAGILADEPARLREAFAQALDDSDVLVTTGGVSVGKYDLVGAAFEALGVEPVLHKVAVKPGKPIWFGLRGETPVFGLPGNPVSTLLGFEVFVRAALVRLAGDAPELEGERIPRGRWVGPERRGGDRQDNLPAGLAAGADGVPELEPLPFHGSADVVAAARAKALAIVPAGGAIHPGELIEYRPLA
jgi:molybdopterin molybdotransferase